MGTVSSILLIHALLLGWIAAVNAPVADEIAHLPAGLSHWRYGRFELYRVNPPLMRMIAALPLLVANPKTNWLMDDSPYARPEFAVGRNFVAANGEDSFWLFTMARWAQIPVSIFGGWICCRWAAELGDKQSGLVALILWCFCPNILAWGSTITPDLGATAFGVAASYAFWQWLKQPTWTTAVVAGLAMGLTELTKSTWIILFGLWPLLWLIWRRVSSSAGTLAAQVSQLAVILLTGMCILNCGYGFENSFRTLKEFTFISRALGGPDAHSVPGNRFRDSWVGLLPVPVPANYLRGIDIQKYDFERPRTSYLRGAHRQRGWYYYYVYGLAVKTPLGALALIAMAIAVTIRRSLGSPSLRNDFALLLPAIAILVLVSCQTGFNRHLRYVLPAIPFLYIFASRTWIVFEAGSRLCRGACAFSLAASVAGSLSVYPHSMSYFNAAAGGPRHGPYHLLHSNIDWGQDLLVLKRFVDRYPEVSPIHLAYYGLMDPSLAGFPFEAVHSTNVRNGKLVLSPGWYAISVNHLFGYQYHEVDNSALVPFQRLTPDAMAGYSIYIFHVTEEKLDRLRQTVPQIP